MTDTDQKKEAPYTEAETAARAEAALKRMLATPHKPHKPKGGGVAVTVPDARSSKKTQ